MSFELTEQDKQFIKDNKELIKVDDWNKFFSNLYEEGPKNIYVARHRIVDLLCSLNVDFLSYITDIPSKLLSSIGEGEIIIPDNITSVGEDAFRFCGFSNVIFKNTKITKLPDYCFKSSFNLESIILPKNLQYIGEGCFETCQKLQEIAIPQSVTHIGVGAFQFIYRMKKIIFECDNVKIDGGIQNMLTWWSAGVHTIIVCHKGSDIDKQVTEVIKNLHYNIQVEYF